MLPAETGSVKVSNTNVKVQKQKSLMLGRKPRFFWPSWRGL